MPLVLLFNRHLKFGQKLVEVVFSCIFFSYGDCETRNASLTRLAAIDGVGGDTGVKPQHRLRHLHRHFDFFYSNKNHLVQLENTTIKTERGC